VPVILQREKVDAISILGKARIRVLSDFTMPERDRAQALACLFGAVKHVVLFSSPLHRGKLEELYASQGDQSLR